MGDEATTMTREQELAEQFKTGLSPDSAVAMQLRVDELEAQVKLLTDENDAAEEEGAANDDQLLKLEQERNELTDKLATVTAERDAAVERADKADKATKAAKAKVSRGDAPARARKIGPIADDQALSGEDLQVAIAKAEKVEVVFSDGKNEITGIPPAVVDGVEAWRQHPLGHLLRENVVIDGPAQGQPAYDLRGYGLLLDGKLVAYRDREPVQVAPGRKVNLADDIVF